VTEAEGTGAFPVKLTMFEGPLDLLLHLVKVNELDIYDIPIADVTSQYMQYLEWMKYLNLEVAGEFLVMAATLTQIKSQMLLPPDSAGTDEDDEEDPREQLIQQLLEYRKFKNLASRLQDLETLQQQTWTRAGAKSPETVELIEVSIFDLIQVLSDIFDKLRKESVPEINPEQIKIEEEMNRILENLESRESVKFRELFSDVDSRRKLIVVFLAILELVRTRMILVYQATLYGEIYMRRRTEQTQ
jgi:segregation and condensation protein A